MNLTCPVIFLDCLAYMFPAPRNDVQQKKNHPYGSEHVPPKSEMAISRPNISIIILPGPSSRGALSGSLYRII